MTDSVLMTRGEGLVKEMILHRPHRMNAFDKALLASFRATLETFRDDPHTRVLIIRGSGGRAFCAGADLKERATLTQEEVFEFVTNLRETFHLLYRHPKITIAAIDGFALGGGLELAMCCDLRYAVEGSNLGLTETGLAIIPGAGGTQLLPRLVGRAKAKELIFKAQPIEAREALAIGLVNHVCPRETLDAWVHEQAAFMAANGPLALTQAKIAIDSGLEVPLADGLDIETQCYNRLIPTQDRLEGLAAFKEKRTPVYRGH